MASADPVGSQVIEEAITHADCIIVVPPFASVLRPALGPHILQAMARARGMSVGVVYANMLFASMIGIREYEGICDKGSRSWLMGERIFARLAHALPALGRNAEAFLQSCDLTLSCQSPLPAMKQASEPDRLPLPEIERATDAFCDLISSVIAASGCRVVGSTSSFEQTNASIALLRAVKQKSASVTTLIGGANCEGEMAHGILDLSPDAIDFVFSGECEVTFPSTLEGILGGTPPLDRIIQGKPCDTMDDIPCPDFSEYFRQLGSILPGIDPAQSWLAYETSRGCWWGQKHHCSFCGLNGMSMSFREKSPEKVLSDVRSMLSNYPTQMLAMTDNIMPHTFHRSLIPKLKDSNINATIFYEQKSNLTLDQVKNLGEAGVKLIQPGIEAVSTALLKRMKKGVGAGQNIALMRYARVCDISLAWNLLAEFPGDSADGYRQTLAVLPHLVHLDPPTGLCPLSIDRFSPYFNESLSYGISNLRPWQSYYSVFPDRAEVTSLAYHFAGDYQSGARDAPDTLDAIREVVDRWQLSWNQTGPNPALFVSAINDATFVLVDTRHGQECRLRFLDRRQAAATLVEGALSDTASEWAISNGFSLAIDGRSIPLAVASYELMKAFADPRWLEQCRLTAESQLVPG